MMGQPRGPGGYGGILRRVMRPMKITSEMTTRRAVVGSNNWLSVWDIEDYILVFFVLAS